MIEFICAVYNEEKEIEDLISHVYPYVDFAHFVDDGSTDRTGELLDLHWLHDTPPPIMNYATINHTGLPETVKAQALEMVQDGSWVLMLDADERFAEGVLDSIQTFYNSPQAAETDYVYFRQVELIDGKPVREFQKSKLFKKDAIKFPLDNIHADDVLIGNGIVMDDWVVYHRKTTDKQVQREIEYLATYRKLLAEGKIDAGRYEWLIGLHHYVTPH